MGWWGRRSQTAGPTTPFSPMNSTTVLNVPENAASGPKRSLGPDAAFSGSISKYSRVRLSGNTIGSHEAAGLIPAAKDVLQHFGSTGGVHDMFEDLILIADARVLQIPIDD